MSSLLQTSAVSIQGVDSEFQCVNVTSTFSGDSNDGHDVEIVAHKKKKEKKEKKSMRSSFERRSSRSIGEERRVSDASDRSNGDGECHASIRDNEDGGGIVPSRVSRPIRATLRRATASLRWQVNGSTATTFFVTRSSWAQRR